MYVFSAYVKEIYACFVRKFFFVVWLVTGHPLVSCLNCRNFYTKWWYVCAGYCYVMSCSHILRMHYCSSPWLCSYTCLTMRNGFYVTFKIARQCRYGSKFGCENKIWIPSIRFQYRNSMKKKPINHKLPVIWSPPATLVISNFILFFMRSFYMPYYEIRVLYVTYRL